MHDEVIQGVGTVTVKATGERIGQFGFELVRATDPGAPYQELQIDLPVAVGVRCKSAGLSLELAADDDSLRCEFVVDDAGPAGVDVQLVGPVDTEARRV